MKKAAYLTLLFAGLLFTTSTRSANERARLGAIGVRVRVLYSDLSPAAGVKVAAHESFTSNNYDLGVTDANGEISRDARNKRQVSVPNNIKCFWPGCPFHDEDDRLDRPSFSFTVTQGPNSMTTPPVLYSGLNNVRIVLPPTFTSPLFNPKPVGHFLRRKNLNTDFTPEEQRELAGLLYNYLDDALMDAHMNEVDHIDNLFTDHRTYLYEMEKRLLRDGHGKYVPLPLWEPLNDIPSGWVPVKPLHGREMLRLTPYNSTPVAARPRVPETLRPERICKENFETAQAVALEIGRSARSAVGRFHFNSHAALGGPFLRMSTAGTALMFWAYHPLLVDVYDKWLTCKFGDATEAALGSNLDGDGRQVMELFRLGLDKRLWHAVQRLKSVVRNDLDMVEGTRNVTFDHWTHWERLSDPREIKRFKVVSDNSGRAVVVAQATDDRLHLMRRSASGWTSWVDLRVKARDFAVAVNGDGRLEIIALKERRGQQPLRGVGGAHASHAACPGRGRARPCPLPAPLFNDRRREAASHVEGRGPVVERAALFRLPF